MKQRTTVSKHKPRRVYRRPFPKGVSGYPIGRGIKGHRFSELQKALSADYGGVDALTPFQKIMLTQACRLLMGSEKARDLDMQVRLSNASKRALAALQRGGADPRSPPPKPKPPSLDDLLRQPERVVVALDPRAAAVLAGQRHATRRLPVGLALRNEFIPLSTWRCSPVFKVH